MKKLSYVLAAIALSTSLAAVADTAPNQHIGAYVEGMGGTNLYALGFVTSDGHVGTAGVGGYALSAALGYNATNWFGVEGGFIRSMVGTGENNPDYQNINAPYVSARFTVPIGQRFSLLAKLGAMYAYGSFQNDNDDIHTENHGLVLPFVGLGASYAVTPKVDITVQYQGAIYGLVNAGALTGGLTYHF